MVQFFRWSTCFYLRFLYWWTWLNQLQKSRMMRPLQRVHRFAIYRCHTRRLVQKGSKSQSSPYTFLIVRLPWPLVASSGSKTVAAKPTNGHMSCAIFFVNECFSIKNYKKFRKWFTNDYLTRTVSKPSHMAMVQNNYSSTRGATAEVTALNFKPNNFDAMSLKQLISEPSWPHASTIQKKYVITFSSLAEV